MEIRTIGIDLGKTVFHLVGLNARGAVAVRKKCSRTQLLRFTSKLRECLIGMEACGGSHFLGRALREQGHDVRLMPAQYVKPYVKTNKNNYIDAEAIAEAVTRPTMRFVPIKSDAQLDLQSLHRVRERWVIRRTAVINQIRGLLLERGITMRKGRKHLEASLPGILEDGENKLSGALRALLTQLRIEMQYLHGQIEECDQLIVRIASELEPCRRLLAIPGIGPVIATATIAAIGNGAAFKKGRGFAAWLGVVPGEHSSGGKQKLTGTSRRGNKYLRIPAKTLRPGSTYRTPAEDEAIFGPEYVAGQSGSTQAQAGGDRGLSQQDGTHGLGGSMQRRGLSPAARTTTSRSLNGPAHDAWHQRQAWKSLKRFPHLQANDDGSKFSDPCQVCWRTMRWHNGRSRRSRNLHSENAFQGSETN
jgi:transposase